MTMLTKIKTLFTAETAVEASTDDPTTDIMADIEAQERATLRARAEKIAKEKRDQAAYTAKIEARREKYLAELHKELRDLWRVMPELRWVLLGLRQLEGRLEELGSGSWEEASGLPFGMAGNLSAAITQALAGTRLGEEAFVEGEVSEPNVTAPHVVTYSFDDRLMRKPPPGFSGIWDVVNCRPLEEET